MNESCASRLLVPTLCVGTRALDAQRPTGRRRASGLALPRGAWERGQTLLRGIAMVSLLLTLSGCAGFKNYFQPAKPGESREERAAEAVKSFEERRDAVQIEAALDRFNQGDAARAEAMLSAVVNRRPDNAEARMRLGEVLWSRGDAAAAEPHFRTVLDLAPTRAEAHHALGLLLDGTGRSDEARQHLLKALELEPQNQVFRQTCDSLALRPGS